LAVAALAGTLAVAALAGPPLLATAALAGPPLLAAALVDPPLLAAAISWDDVPSRSAAVDSTIGLASIASIDSPSVTRSLDVGNAFYGGVPYAHGYGGSCYRRVWTRWGWRQRWACY